MEKGDNVVASLTIRRQAMTERSGRLLGWAPLLHPSQHLRDLRVHRASGLAVDGHHDTIAA